MKKLMFVVAAMAAGVAMADSIASANLVGFTTCSINKGETKMLAVNFENAADAAAIPVKSLCTAAAGFYGNSTPDSADQIWTYSQATGWAKYYYKGGRGVTPCWAVNDSTKAAIDDSVTVAPGTSIFFVRGGEATTLTFSGGVVDLSAVKEVSVAKGETKLICNPWPTDLKISDFTSCYASGSEPYGNSTPDSADQIWLYNQSTGWTKYYYKGGRGVTPCWAINDSTKAAVTDADVIPAGKGFFFVRGGTACTLSFKGPSAE